MSESRLSEPEPVSPDDPIIHGLRWRNEAIGALEEILDDLGANRHIRWAPNYPEVDHAIQVAQGALAALRGR